MIDRRRPQVAHEFRDQFELAFAILVPGVRRQEISRIGEPVRTDWTEVRQAQERAVIFADVTPRCAIEELDAEAHATRDDDDLLWLDGDAPEFGRKAQAALLRNDQQLA